MLFFRLYGGYLEHTVSTPAINISKAITIATLLSIFSSFSNTLSSEEAAFVYFLFISDIDLSIKEIMILKDKRKYISEKC